MAQFTTLSLSKMYSRCSQSVACEPQAAPVYHWCASQFRTEHLPNMSNLSVRLFSMKEQELLGAQRVALLCAGDVKQTFHRNPASNFEALQIHIWNVLQGIKEDKFHFISHTCQIPFW